MSGWVADPAMPQTKHIVTDAANRVEATTMTTDYGHTAWKISAHITGVIYYGICAEGFAL